MYAYVTETCAVDVCEPNIPNTKPPIATAATKVTAMRVSVAMMGEMPFLWYLFPRIGGYRLSLI
jgi:hypothetical protein